MNGWEHPLERMLSKVRKLDCIWTFCYESVELTEPRVELVSLPVHRWLLPPDLRLAETVACSSWTLVCWCMTLLQYQTSVKNLTEVQRIDNVLSVARHRVDGVGHVVSVLKVVLRRHWF